MAICDKYKDSSTTITPEIEERLRQESEKHVYYEPPNGTQIQYPCIIYKLNRVNTQYSNDLPYAFQNQYSVTIITEDPDTTIKDYVARMKTAAYDRSYTEDNMHHYVYTIYY